MASSKTLGFFLITPAVIIIVMLFLVPVVMTAVFAFTNMSTATASAAGKRFTFESSPTPRLGLRNRIGESIKSWHAEARGPDLASGNPSVASIDSSGSVGSPSGLLIWGRATLADGRLDGYRSSEVMGRWPWV